MPSGGRRRLGELVTVGSTEFILDCAFTMTGCLSWRRPSLAPRVRMYSASPSRAPGGASYVRRRSLVSCSQDTRTASCARPRRARGWPRAVSVAVVVRVVVEKAVKESSGGCKLVIRPQAACSCPLCSGSGSLLAIVGGVTSLLLPRWGSGPSRPRPCLSNLACRQHLRTCAYGSCGTRQRGRARSKSTPGVGVRACAERARVTVGTPVEDGGLAAVETPRRSIAFPFRGHQLVADRGRTEAASSPKAFHRGPRTGRAPPGRTSYCRSGRRRPAYRRPR